MMVPDQLVSEAIKAYGASAVTIILLVYAVIKLFLRNEQLTDKYTALAIKLAEVLEQNTASRNQMTSVFQQLKHSVDEAMIVPKRKGRQHEPD